LNLRSLKTRRSLICGSKRRLAFTAAVAFAASTAVAGPCVEKNEIVYNAMYLLAGSGDTIGVASYDQKGWALNLTTTRGDRWWGYSLECHADKTLYDIAFGDRTLAVILNPLDYDTYRSRPSTIWWYSYRDGRTHERQIKWHERVLAADTLAIIHPNDLVAAGGLFYLACRGGGLLEWDPVADRIRGFIPGDTGSFDPASMDPALFPSFGSSAETGEVMSVDKRLSVSGDEIVAVTPPRLWLFKTGEATWDSSVTSTLADSTLSFKGFVSSSVNNSVSPSILYAYIRTGNGVDSLVSLFRYRFGERRWVRLIKDGPSVIAPASRGYLYCVSGKNAVEVYRDSLSDSAMPPAIDIEPILRETDFYKRIEVVSQGIAKPDINDMLFVPVTDSSGHLTIAASAERPGADGLFLSYDEVPGVSTVFFSPLRRDKVIAGGLRESYALPGILSDNYLQGASTALFVYKLGKDANVTIRIYDFAMQHVKTVIEKEPRKASTPTTGRSTDPRFDLWDGRTASGRVAAPGVYYYKITTDKGERSFGKIVVAKGAG
jgi:hypothetical protein